MFGNAYKEPATGATASNGFRVTSLFPCDKNIFRPQDFPLTSGNTDVAPLNHPALVKTSAQPSFNSSAISPFISVEVLRASDISPVPNLNLKHKILALCQPEPKASDISPVTNLNLKPTLRVGTAKKIRSSPYKKFVEANQREKIKRTTKSKNLTNASHALPFPSKKTE